MTVGLQGPAENAGVVDVLEEDNGRFGAPGACCAVGDVAAAGAAALDSGIELVPGTDGFADVCRALDGRSFGYRVAKRAFDIAFSAVVIAVGLVPCAVLSVAIAIDTKGSPIYSQERVGRLGRPFRIYKFRSMVADADDVEKYLTPAQLAQ